MVSMRRAFAALGLASTTALTACGNAEPDTTTHPMVSAIQSFCKTDATAAQQAACLIEARDQSERVVTSLIRNDKSLTQALTEACFTKTESPIPDEDMQLILDASNLRSCLTKVEEVAPEDKETKLIITSAKQGLKIAGL